MSLHAPRANHSLILLFFEGEINKPNRDKTIIGGIRESDLKEFTKLTNTEARSAEYELNQAKIKEILLHSSYRTVIDYARCV